MIPPMLVRPSSLRGIALFSTVSSCRARQISSFFFLYGSSTTGTYTLSLHDALPILGRRRLVSTRRSCRRCAGCGDRRSSGRCTADRRRSEEHTSELQSHHDLVCRLLLEKKNPTDDPANASAPFLAPRHRSVLDS